MQVIIQAVEERKNNVEVLTTKLPNAFVYWDLSRQGNYKTFVESLSMHENSDYTLRLQDDIVLPSNFAGYLPTMEDIMIKNNLDILSLFSLKRKFLDEQFSKGITISEYPNFLMMQAVIFSKNISSQLLKYSEISKTNKYDDVLIRDFLKDTKQKAYVHLPSLVQHRIDIKSTFSSPASKTRQSNTFDKNYITNELNKNN